MQGGWGSPGRPSAQGPALPPPGTQGLRDRSTYCVPGGAPGAGATNPFLRKLVQAEPGAEPARGWVGVGRVAETQAGEGRAGVSELWRTDGVPEEVTREQNPNGRVSWADVRTEVPPGAWLRGSVPPGAGGTGAGGEAPRRAVLRPRRPGQGTGTVAGSLSGLGGARRQPAGEVSFPRGCLSLSLPLPSPALRSTATSPREDLL